MTAAPPPALGPPGPRPMHGQSLWRVCLQECDQESVWKTPYRVQPQRGRPRFCLCVCVCVCVCERERERERRWLLTEHPVVVISR